MSFAVRHPSVNNLWFDFTACQWTFSHELRTVFALKEDAEEYAALPMDGGIVCCVD